MKKRLLALCLTLCLLVGLLPTAVLAVPEANGTGQTAEDPMVVPADDMVINNGTYYGVSKTWFARVNPDKGTFYVALQIPGTVTTIANDAFRYNYTGDKKEYGAVIPSDNLGQCKVAAIDFSQATNLTTIKYQAAMSCSDISGVLNLSNTKVKTIEKSAFSGCIGLTGVILPQTLEVLGTSDGSSGSVFNGCTGLEFVRTAGGSETADFELPSGLKVIGKHTFRNTFPSGSDLKIRIPASVEIVGSEAFYSNSAFSQIYLNRESGYTQYDEGAFKAKSTADCLLIFPNAAAYVEFGTPARATRTFPATLNFTENGIVTETQIKLAGQSIQYTRNQSGIWEIDEDYTLPDISNVETVPGYDAGWKLSGGKEVLTNTSKVIGTATDEGVMTVTVENGAVVSKPTVEYMVNGSVVQDAGSGVPGLTVTVDQENPGTVGVQVTHPLATEEAKESGTYVYFEYCWWDEKDNSVNGPRSETEPDLFSTAITSSNYSRVFTDQNVIPIRNISDTRTDGDYYLVEIYGYYVKNSGTAKQFYKSGHNFIAGDNATDRSYVMNVDVVDTTPITITPADITVYTGGEGYTGAVDNAGQESTAANGLPEPGYYITLPNELNAILGGDANAEDLSEILKFTYEDDQGRTREWKLELYGTEAHSSDVEDAERQRYIYRMLPGVDENEQEIPVRLQFTDSDGNVTISDEFTPNMEEQYQEYTMSIYSGGLDTSKITASLTLSDGQTVTCGVNSADGNLVVRGLTGEDITTGIISKTDELSGDEITALATNDVTYYINGSNVELKDTEGVRLLVDDVLDDGVLVEYIQNNMTETVPAGDYAYEQQYLDLVDTKNGNAYLTMGEEDSLTIYWKVPDGFDSNKPFYVVHFDALNRNYSKLEDELSRNAPDLLTAQLVTVNGTEYVTFNAKSFSPFVLVYEEESGGGGGTHYSYTLRYDTNGGEAIQSESKNYSWTKQYEDLPTPVREGYTFDGWYLDSKLTDPVEDDVKVNRSTVTLYAAWSKDKTDPDNNGVSDWLNTRDHNAYLNGYDNGAFGPDDNMTRAQVAQMFYNLLLNKEVPVTTSFTDVPADAWYAKAVNSLASLGILEGVGNNLFAPDRPITRAEFTVIAMRFTEGDVTGTNIFSDVHTNDWFYDHVVGSIQYGWITGYADGTFQPNKTISRAEVTTIVNRMLGRSADQHFVDQNSDKLRAFPDVPLSHWAYYQIVEATNSHNYTKGSDGETWSLIL